MMMFSTPWCMETCNRHHDTLICLFWSHTHIVSWIYFTHRNKNGGVVKKNCLYIQIRILLKYTYQCPYRSCLSPREILTVKLTDHFNIIATEIALHQKTFQNTRFPESVKFNISHSTKCDLFHTAHYFQYRYETNHLPYFTLFFLQQEDMNPRHNRISPPSSSNRPSSYF
jgi:hypothetical protein